MANKGKKLTLVNAGKALKAKTVRRNVKGVDSEGNEVLFYIEVDDKNIFIVSLKCRFKLVANL
jgi:hypothetical protein